MPPVARAAQLAPLNLKSNAGVSARRLRSSKIKPAFYQIPMTHAHRIDQADGSVLVVEHRNGECIEPKWLPTPSNFLHRSPLEKEIMDVIIEIDAHMRRPKYNCGGYVHFPVQFKEHADWYTVSALLHRLRIINPGAVFDVEAEHGGPVPVNQFYKGAPPMRCPRITFRPTRPAAAPLVDEHALAPFKLVARDGVQPALPYLLSIVPPESPAAAAAAPANDDEVVARIIAQTAPLIEQLSMDEPRRALPIESYRMKVVRPLDTPDPKPKAAADAELDEMMFAHMDAETGDTIAPEFLPTFAQTVARLEKDLEDMAATGKEAPTGRPARDELDAYNRRKQAEEDARAEPEPTIPHQYRIEIEPVSKLYALPQYATGFSAGKADVADDDEDEDNTNDEGQLRDEILERIGELAPAWIAEMAEHMRAHLDPVAREWHDRALSVLVDGGYEEEITFDYDLEDMRKHMCFHLNRCTLCLRLATIQQAMDKILRVPPPLVRGPDPDPVAAGVTFRRYERYAHELCVMLAIVASNILDKGAHDDWGRLDAERLFAGKGDAPDGRRIESMVRDMLCMDVYTGVVADKHELKARKAAAAACADDAERIALLEAWCAQRPPSQPFAIFGDVPIAVQRFVGADDGKFRGAPQNLRQWSNLQILMRYHEQRFRRKDSSPVRDKPTAPPAEPIAAKPTVCGFCESPPAPHRTSMPCDKCKRTHSICEKCLFVPRVGSCAACKRADKDPPATTTAIEIVSPPQVVAGIKPAPDFVDDIEAFVDVDDVLCAECGKATAPAKMSDWRCAHGKLICAACRLLPLARRCAHWHAPLPAATAPERVSDPVDTQPAPALTTTAPAPIEQPAVPQGPEPAPRGTVTSGGPPPRAEEEAKPAVLKRPIRAAEARRRVLDAQRPLVEHAFAEAVERAMAAGKLGLVMLRNDDGVPESAWLRVSPGTMLLVQVIQEQGYECHGVFEGGVEVSFEFTEDD